MRSLRRHTATSVASLAAYEPSVIVGKLEFDIDRRRGAGRWYEAWIEQAEHAHALPPPSVTASSPAAFPPSSFNSPAYTTAFASPADTQRRGSAPNTAEFHSPYANQAHQQARGPGKAELYLPNFVNRKSQQPLSSSRSVSPSSSTQPTLQSLAREERGSLNISIDDSRAGQTATSAPHLPHGQEEDTSAFRQQQGYTQLTDEEESRYGGDTDADTTSQPSFAPESNPRTSHQGSDRSRKSSDQPSNDPLSDVFGSEETTWKTLATAGLGLGTMPDALAVKLSSEADENVESPIDDVRDIKELLKRRSEDTTKKQRSNVQLSSPIHLDQAQFSGPSVNSPSQFETSMAHTESIVVTSSTPPSASTVTRGSPADQQDLVTSNQSVVTAVPEQSGQSDGFVPPPVPSSWNSFAALHEDPATPSAPINDTTKRESFDVDFDNLEKALAELSPQAMKRKGATPSKGSSSRPSGPSSATSPISPRAVTSTSEQLNALERASSQASTNSVQTTATTGSRDAASQSSAQSPKNGTSRVTSIQTDASSVVARVLATESSPPLPKVPEVEDADDRSAPQAAETSRIQFLDQAQPRSGDSTSFSAGSTSKLTGGQGAGEESQHAPRHSDAEPQVSPDPARPLAAAPISTSSTSTEPATVTPTNTGFQGAPTTFDSILAEQNRKPSESHPPRGSSLQHSLRRPWAARSPNHTTSPQPSQSSKEEGSSTGFMKIFRKNTSASNSDAQGMSSHPKLRSCLMPLSRASDVQGPVPRGGLQAAEP